MRRSDTIEGLTDKVCYLRAMVDAGSLNAIEPFIVARDRLKKAMEKQLTEQEERKATETITVDTLTSLGDVPCAHVITAGHIAIQKPFSLCGR